MASMRLVLLLPGLFLAAGCDVIEVAAHLPVITPDPANFPVTITSERDLTATITQKNLRMENPALRVTCIVYTRPTPASPTAGLRTLDAVQGEWTSWTCPLPANFVIHRRHVLGYQWLVRNPTDLVGDSGIKEQIVDCRDPSGAVTPCPDVTSVPGTMAQRAIPQKIKGGPEKALAMGSDLQEPRARRGTHLARGHPDPA